MQEKNCRLKSLEDSFKSYKGYKVCSPEETISRVTAGLGRYSTTPFSYDEDVINQSFLPDIGVVTGTIKFADNSLASSGKGSNSIYCKASAYAEFAERASTKSFRSFQHLLASYKNAKSSADYIYAPKKAVGTTIPDSYFYDRGFISKADEALRHEIDSIPQLWKKSVSLISGEEVLYPYLWHTISDFTNGIASGNTHEEALVHGICEVIERHARLSLLAGQSVAEEVRLDTLPEPYDHWVEMLQDIGMQVRVFDLSFGGIPVVGMLFTDESFPDHLRPLRRWHKHILMVGSNPDPKIALERCFTEFYQSYMPHLVMQKEFAVYDEILRIWGYDDQIDFPFHTNTNRMNRIPYRTADVEKRFDEIESIYTVNHKDELNKILASLSAIGFDVIAEDCTDPMIQFPVVRVFIPQVNFSVIESPKIVLAQLKAIDALVTRQFSFVDDLSSPNYSVYFGPSTFVSAVYSDEWRSDRNKLKMLINAMELRLNYAVVLRHNGCIPTGHIGSGIDLLRDLYIENVQFEHALTLTDFLLSSDYTNVEHLTKRYFIQDRMQMRDEAIKTKNLICRVDARGESQQILNSIQEGGCVSPNKYWSVLELSS